jgi:hypothetical protein
MTNDVTTLTVTGWTKNGVRIDNSPELDGYCYADYFRDGKYLGPDQDGIEPVFANA